MSEPRNFWASRKAGIAAEAEAEIAALEAQTLAEEQRQFEDKSDAEILAELDLPDPDAMVMGDDFAVFMSKAVPDRIRRRALRTLWRSNPVLANVDMLVDYGEDFTDKATVIENMQTAYQVGKGMLKHIEEMARQAEEKENPAVAEEINEEDDAQDALVATQEQEMSSDDVGEPMHDPEPIEDQDLEIAMVPAPRRMKFRTQERAA
ncbi:MAG: DUF3306 domain-containing protein [Sulfitobacter sp.]